MKINIENLGIIKNALINTDKNFTVFAGKNNTGKSYLNYLLYGVLSTDKFANQHKFYNRVKPLIINKIKINIDNNKRKYKFSFNISDFFRKKHSKSV